MSGKEQIFAFFIPKISIHWGSFVLKNKGWTWRSIDVDNGLPYFCFLSWMSEFPDLSKPYVILEEDYDHLYDPTEEEIRKEAIWMGMDPEKEKNLLWIARDALRVFLSYKT